MQICEARFTLHNREWVAMVRELEMDDGFVEEGKLYFDDGSGQMPSDDDEMDGSMDGSVDPTEAHIGGNNVVDYAAMEHAHWDEGSNDSEDGRYDRQDHY